MPLCLRPDIVEGKVYRRNRRKKDNDDEDHALKELQTILNTKNRRPCDCEAQVHDLLENCLNCGRLACVSEGSGKCFCCDNVILNQDQRSRLKKYIDIPQVPSHSGQAETSGLKTMIIDNQFDQFSIEDKRHLTKEEKAQRKEQLDDLQRQRYQRKLILQVDIDNLDAGYIRSVNKIDDYEGMLQNLQLDDRVINNTSKFTLAELVHNESKRNFEHVYIEPINEPILKPSSSSTNERPPRKPRNKKSAKNNVNPKKTSSNSK